MDNKQITTIIVGTAKSKVGSDEYYITERLKMWGIMFIAGFTDKYYQPNEWKEFSAKYCVGFYDVVEETIPKDKTLKSDLREKRTNSIVYKVYPDVLGKLVKVNQ